MKNDLEHCVTPPQAYRASFASLLADYGKYHLERFGLERAFDVPKPYELLKTDEKRQLPSGGASHILTLGNVYFNRERTMAAIYTWAYCGGLCGFGSWRVFLKNDKGGWDEQQWTLCATAA